MLASVAVAAGLTACDRSSDPLAACRAAQGRAFDAAGGHDRVIQVCGAAHAATGDADALAAVAMAHLAKHEIDGVLAIAAAAPDRPSSARIWRSAAEAEMQRGNRAAARAWFERTLKAQRGRDPIRAFNTALGLSDLAVLDDDLEMALDYAHQGMEEAIASGDPPARMSASLALANLFLLAIGDRRAAASTLATVADLADDRTSFGHEYALMLGELADRAGQEATAAAAYESCLDGIDTANEPLVAVQCNLGLARQHVTARAPTADGLTRAARHLEAAVALEPAVLQLRGPDPDRAGERGLLAVELARARGRRADATAMLTELSRQPLGTSLRVRVETRLGELLAETGRADEAEVALQDAAAAVEKLRDGAHYREIRAALATELREPYEALFDLRARRGNVVGALAAMERALTRDFIDQLVAEPGAGPERSVDVAVADAIRRTALRRQLDVEAAAAPRPASDASTATVIAFFSARGALWRATLQPDRLSTLALVGDLDALAPIIAATREDPASPAAKELADRLLDTAAWPAANAPVVIVPDRVLDGVRLGALRVDGRFLVERHPLIVAPTLRIATSAAASATTATGAVVIGDPTGDLPGARREAREVASALGVPALVGREATRARLAEARRAAVLHIAAHGDRAAGRSTLRLADGDLTVGDLLTLHLAPDLVVVASCVSAAQDRDAMWTSIGAGLLASGAHGVLGVDGKLPDAAGHDLVADFYRHGGVDRPATALALAQRDAIDRGIAPEVWSMMVYLGSPHRADVAVATALSNVTGGHR